MIIKTKLIPLTATKLRLCDAPISKKNESYKCHRLNSHNKKERSSYGWKWKNNRPQKIHIYYDFLFSNPIDSRRKGIEKEKIVHFLLSEQKQEKLVERRHSRKKRKKKSIIAQKLACEIWITEDDVTQQRY